MYKLILNLHIIAAFSFIGAILFVAISGVKLSQNKIGAKIVKRAHVLSAIAGATLFLTGLILVYSVSVLFLTYHWMQFSIALFLFIQFFDHFWADRQERRNGNSILKFSYLHSWLILKVFLSLIIMFLMYVKPMR